MEAPDAHRGRLDDPLGPGRPIAPIAVTNWSLRKKVILRPVRRHSVAPQKSPDGGHHLLGPLVLLLRLGADHARVGVAVEQS